MSSDVLLGHPACGYAIWSVFSHCRGDCVKWRSPLRFALPLLLLVLLPAVAHDSDTDEGEHRSYRDSDRHNRAATVGG